MTEHSIHTPSLVASEIRLREITPADLPACHALSQAVAWPHRLEDWELACQCGKGWVAESAGKVIGSALYWQWGSTYSTLGLVIVSPDCQGRGVGKALLNAVLAQLEGMTVRLHATPEGKPLYEKLGFVTTGGVCQHQNPELPVIAAPTLSDDCQFRPLIAEDATTLTELDRLSSGMQRPVLYKALLDAANLTHIEKTLMLTRNGQPAGFSMLRKFGRGHTIGPVIADNLDDAKRLVAQLLSESAGKFVRLDVESTSGLSEWLEELGLPCIDRPTTMYKNGGPLVSPSGWRNFSLMSQAMG
ncbi:MAG: GNAT family N-acetyltransferase [Ewingella sp.]